MKSPCALLLPLFIHPTNAHTHRTIVNVLQKELGRGEGPIAAVGLGQDKLCRKILSAVKKNRQRRSFNISCIYSVNMKFEILKLGKRTKANKRSEEAESKP